MDKELFRLILLVVGVALVATVYYWDRLRGLFSPPRAAAGRKPVSEHKPAVADSPWKAAEIVENDENDEIPEISETADEEAFDNELGELEALIRADDPVDVLLQDLPQSSNSDRQEAERTAAAQPRDDDVETVDQKSAVTSAPARMLALTLVATSGSISGIRLRRVLTDHGLGLGSRGLFERIGEEGRPLYCAANLVEPGLFDPLTLDGVSTPGLVLFQMLEGSADHTVVFDAMLETAKRLADRLDCTLCDARRERLGASGIAALRAEAEQAGDQAAP